MKTTVDVASLSVNDVIRSYPVTVEVFNRYGIDACCGGAASVVEAAIRDGAEPAALVQELRAAIARAE